MHFYRKAAHQFSVTSENATRLAARPTEQLQFWLRAGQKTKSEKSQSRYVTVCSWICTCPSPNQATGMCKKVRMALYVFLIF